MIFKFLKKLFSAPTVLTEKQLLRMDKDELETYARTLGLELDKRHNKDKLIEQILDELKYH
jgi:hypothetical protein